MSFETPLARKRVLREIVYGESKLEVMSDLFRSKIHSALEANRPQMKDFQGIYGTEIKKDEQKIREFKQSPEYKIDNDEIGQLGEDIMIYGCQTEKWLPTVDVLLPNKFDDYFRGTDLILKFNSQAGPLYLGMDVKTVKDNTHMLEKKRIIQNRLEQGKLTELKYFKDAAAGKLGALELPSVVIVIDPRFAVAMQNILVKAPEARNDSERQKTDLIKTLLQLETLSSLFAMDLYLDLEKFNQPLAKNMQKKYQQIISAIITQTDLKQLMEELEQLNETIASLREPLPAERKKYQEMKMYMEEYFERRDIKI